MTISAGALVWLNGALVPRAAATVSIDDLGFLYGAGCFETMRAYGRVVFRLSHHIDRLEAGLRELGVRGVPARADLEAAIRRTLEANGLVDARVRLTISAGAGNGRPDLGAASRPTVLIAAEPTPTLPPSGPPSSRLPVPVTLSIASVRVDAGRPLAGAKTANFLPYLLAAAEARRAGSGSAVLLNERGAVAEAATANLFVVTAGRVVTPPLSDGPLPGVTRAAVLEAAAARGLDCAEASLTLDQLRGAEEAFLSSSVDGLTPVSSVDGSALPRCPGPATEALIAAYEALVRRECGV